MAVKKKIALDFDAEFQHLQPYHSSGSGVPLSAYFTPTHLKFFPVGTMEKPAEGNIHLHQRFVMIMVHDGDFQIDTVPHQQILHAGECLIIPPFSRHSVYDNFGRRFQAIFASFQLDAGQKRLEALGERVIKLRQSDWRDVLRCVRNFMYACEGSRISGMTAAAEFGLFLENLYERELPEPEADYNGIRYPEHLAGMISRIICEDFDHWPTISQIAQKCNVSPSTARQVFKNVMGVGIGKYICARHLDVALEMLKSTDLPMAEIAQRIGFSSAASMSNAIRRECGVPPSQFRRRSSRNKTI